jgi:hypothetical protein
LPSAQEFQEPGSILRTDIFLSETWSWHRNPTSGEHNNGFVLFYRFFPLNYISQTVYDYYIRKKYHFTE